MSSNNRKTSESQKKKLIIGVSVPVFIMGLVSLFTDMSSEIIQSIFPFFIIFIGGTFASIGILTGVTNALSNVLKGVTGFLSDKLNKRKPFVVGGYTLSNLTKPFIAFSSSWGMALGLKAIDRAGKGLRSSARDTLISYYAVEKGKAFGLHRAMDTMGAVLGSLFAFILLIFSWDYSRIIFISIIPGIFAIILILLIKDVDPSKLPKSPKKKESELNQEKLGWKFLKLIIILGVIEFASLDIAFLMIRSLAFLGSELIYMIPLLYLLSNIIYMILSPFTGRLSDKIGRKPIIAIGLVVLLINCIILAFPVEPGLYSMILIVVLFCCFGFYLASVDPISRAYIADLTGKNKRGKAYGAYYLFVGLISLVEAVIFGIIYEMFSYTIAFIYISIILLIGIVIFVLTDFSKIMQKDS